MSRFEYGIDIISSFFPPVGKMKMKKATFIYLFLAYLVNDMLPRKMTCMVAHVKE